MKSLVSLREEQKRGTHAINRSNPGGFQSQPVAKESCLLPSLTSDLKRLKPTTATPDDQIEALLKALEKGCGRVGSVSVGDSPDKARLDCELKPLAEAPREIY